MAYLFVVMFEGQSGLSACNEGVGYIAGYDIYLEGYVESSNAFAKQARSTVSRIPVWMNSVKCGSGLAREGDNAV